MRLAVLGSGSGGNAAVVEVGDTRVLIDAGLSAKQLCRRLDLLGIAPASLSGILLTHEHGDHVRGLRVFAKSCSAPLYASAHTSEVVREKVAASNWKIFPCGGQFAIDALSIESFLVPHDAVEPVGFILRHSDHSLAIISDAGHVPARTLTQLESVGMLFIEANYDDAMLEADQKRPWSTKQRIASRHGHLSNAQMAEAVTQLSRASLQHVVLGHLSRDCNSAEVALAAVAPSGLEAICAAQDEPTPWLDVPCVPTIAGVPGRAIVSPSVG